jgi:hypothetical protein
MFKVEILNNGIVTNVAEFESVPKCSQWIAENSQYFPDGFSSQITNISEQKQFEADERQALLNQNIGRGVLAKIYAINMQKIRLGLLSPSQLQALLSDQTLANIERLLLNGSLGSALQIIINLPDTYFNTEQKQIILNYINENK